MLCKRHRRRRGSRQNTLRPPRWVMPSRCRRGTASRLTPSSWKMKEGRNQGPVYPENQEGGSPSGPQKGRRRFGLPKGSRTGGWGEGEDFGLGLTGVPCNSALQRDRWERRSCCCYPVLGTWPSTGPAGSSPALVGWRLLLSNCLRQMHHVCFSSEKLESSG